MRRNKGDHTGCKAQSCVRFDDFHVNFTYKRRLKDKPSVSLVGSEALEGRERFRDKRTVILMGTNATGKTSLGRALHRIFSSIKEANEATLRDLYSGNRPAEFQVDFVNEGFTLHRFWGFIGDENVTFRCYSAEVGEMDSYEMQLESWWKGLKKPAAALKG